MIISCTGAASRIPDDMATVNLTSSNGTTSYPKMPITRLDWIGETIIPNDAKFADTLIGGLSGIDYDPQRNLWVMISDDRSDHAPARAYMGHLPITRDYIGPFQFERLVQLKQPDGSLYPSKNDYQEHTRDAVPDFESIRFNPNNQFLRYTSEGDRQLGLNPFIRNATHSGDYLGALPLPKAFKIDPQHPTFGFYNNLALEGSSFTPDGRHYFVAMEAPLQQDGRVPSLTQGADSRVIEYNRHGKIIAQYVYPIDPLPAEPGPGKHADNGVSEILAINKRHLLVLERAGIQDAEGNYHNYIRIYQTDLRGATNVNGQNKLVPGHYQPMHKRLLLNLNTLKLPLLDNVEGMCFGPELANGRRTLVLISDNNFNQHEITQILAFEVILADAHN
jgi:hypothetical protein